MREKKEKLVVSFLTTTQAMAAEKYCQKNRIPGRIIPLPSEISAECGIAWCTEPEEEERIRQVINDGGIQAEGIHRYICINSRRYMYGASADRLGNRKN